MEEYVELMVATPAITFFFPNLAVSNAASITSSSSVADSGTQSVLPLLAISWSSIFVAILLKPFFRNVPSVAIWHTILLVSKHNYLICLYCVFIWLGMMIKQILQPSFSLALYIQSSSAVIALRPSYSPALIFFILSLTASLLEVDSNTSKSSCTLLLLNDMTPTYNACLLLKIGWLNNWNWDYLPYGIFY